jgi:hypothetical protein
MITYCSTNHETTIRNRNFKKYQRLLKFYKEFFGVLIRGKRDHLTAYKGMHTR